MTINNLFLYGHAPSWKTSTNPARYCRGQIKGAVCFVWRDLRPYLCETRSVVTDCGARSVCMWGFMGRVGKKSTRRSRAGEVGERAAATQNMDRAFTWPCALWVRQVAASSTGPPTWASCCCYCRRRHWSVCCRWEAYRRTHTHSTHTHSTISTHTQTYRCQTPALGLAKTQNCRRMSVTVSHCDANTQNISVREHRFCFMRKWCLKITPSQCNRFQNIKICENTLQQ